MRNLWRKAAKLLLEFPVLWVPYLAAELLAIGLWRLRGMAEKGIFRWFSTSHSVLGGNMEAPAVDHATLAKASLAYAPIGLATIFVVVSLFVIALVVTAGMVDAIGREENPDARAALAGIAPRCRRILLFSLVFLAAFGFAGAGVLLPAVYLLKVVHRLELAPSTALSFGLAPVVVGCAAWMVTPLAIRLLRAGATGPVSVQIRKRGTIMAILAAEAGIALGVISQKFEAHMMFGSRWEGTALSLLNSILANAPDVLLFIALALLSTECAREMERSEDSKMHRILQALMPLHFGHSKEP